MKNFGVSMARQVALVKIETISQELKPSLDGGRWRNLRRPGSWQLKQSEDTTTQQRHIMPSLKRIMPLGNPLYFKTTCYTGIVVFMHPR